MMAVSKRTRYEVLRRDEFRCRYCQATENPLTVDHVTPVALGGSDDPSNLVAACKDCNAGKSSATPDAALVADVESDAVRWAAAMTRAAEIVDGEEAAFSGYAIAFYNVWKRWMPDSVDGTLRALYKAGLPQNMMVEAAEVALDARYVDDRFRYFCGCAWKKVKRLQEIAAEELRGDGRLPGQTPEEAAWGQGYESAEKRYRYSDTYAEMLSSVVDGRCGSPWGPPDWWSDLHPRQWDAA